MKKILNEGRDCYIRGGDSYSKAFSQVMELHGMEIGSGAAAQYWQYREVFIKKQLQRAPYALRPNEKDVDRVGPGYIIVAGGPESQVEELEQLILTTKRDGQPPTLSGLLSHVTPKHK